MSNPPRIWLDYRPVRIGWLVETSNVSQLVTAVSWTTCLWGGRFNPIIPLQDPDLANRLIQAFGVDVLIPIVPSDAAKAFAAAYPHLHLTIWGDGIFREKHCDFVDIRHAVQRATGRAGSRATADLSAFVRPVWSPDDIRSPLFTLLFGRYPTPEEITLNYVGGIRNALDMPDKVIDREGDIPAELTRHISPLGFTGFDLSWRRERSNWINPGLVVGDAMDFDDLLLFWNLQAAGASMCFYDGARADHCKPFIDAFLATIRDHAAEEPKRVNIWGRALHPPWTPSSLVVDLSGLQPGIFGSGDAMLWNGMNINPAKPHFSFWHRDVVASYAEDDRGASASFALSDRPFDDNDPQALDQHYVVTVDANQYGSTSDELTFESPYVPRLNEFYGRNFHFDYDKARAERGSFGHGAVGFITSVGTQRLEARAFRVQDWLHSFFELFGIATARSEPGLRAARLIRQMGGLRASHVLKVRGARELIRKYGPDRSFTRGEAEKCIGSFDEQTKQMRFADFEGLYIQARPRGGKLTPGEVLQYMTAKGVFRVGLEFKCPACELPSWLHLDEAKTLSTCAYCGHQFNVTPQLKDRDWRYRRSGLFGRDDNQLGSVPVALALQQLETSLHDSLLMYSTALNFTSTTAAIEKCEADFVAVVAGAAGLNERPVQILLGEAKTHLSFDGDDVRKLGKLADAIPRDVAEAFIMFAKADAFTPDEIVLAKTLNLPHRQRVILWSQDELEPYHVYERAKDRLGQSMYATTLTNMAQVTAKLWFSSGDS